MKRSRQEIKAEINELGRKRARLSEELAKTLRRIHVLNLLSAEARDQEVLLVRWEAFVCIATQDSIAWRATALDDASACMNEDSCWYRRNSDRSGELKGLYRLSTLGRDATEFVLCDMCIRLDSQRKDVIYSSPDKTEEVAIAVHHFEDAAINYFRVCGIEPDPSHWPIPPNLAAKK